MTPAVKRWKPATVDFDALARLLGAEAMSDYMDRVDHYSSGEVYAHAAREARERGETEDQAEEAGERAEEADRDEACTKYADAVVSVADSLFGEHGLELAPISHRKSKTAWEWRVVPRESWRAACNEIRETVNGVGYFRIESTAEMIRTSSCVSARDCVMGHLHWIKRWPDVYGEPSVTSRIDRAMR